jgi:hypothetical protein
MLRLLVLLARLFLLTTLNPLVHLIVVNLILRLGVLLLRVVDVDIGVATCFLLKLLGQELCLLSQFLVILELFVKHLVKLVFDIWVLVFLLG